MKLIHLSILVISLSIVVARAEDEALTIRKDDEFADVVGVWKSTRNKLTLFPDRRFEMGPGPKIEYGIWEESKDRGFYLRYRARNTRDAGVSRAGHFLFKRGEIVFNHDDEVERFEKVGEVDVVEENGIQESEGLTEPMGTVKLMGDFSNRVALFLRDFEKLKPGMRRGEIGQLFPIDGGLHSASQMRFVHPECPYFKVDVEFEFKRNPDDQNRAIRGDDDRATRISKPYIEAPHLD